MNATPRPRRRFPRAPLAAAAVALVAAATLLGGPATFATWTDSSSQAAHVVSSARGLSLTASATSAPYDLDPAARPSSTRATSTTGLVPGIRGQRITYTMTSGVTDGVQGRIAGTIKASAKTTWPAVYTAGYLDTVATSSGKCAVDPTPTVVANALTWTFATATTQTMRPGETCTVVLDLSIPAVKNGIDVSRTLKTSRGTGTRLNPLADFIADAVVTQVPRAEQK